MISLNKKYKTKGGKEARIYAVNCGGTYPVHGAYRSVDGDWVSQSWTNDGMFNLSDCLGSDFDLVEVVDVSDLIDRARELADWLESESEYREDFAETVRLLIDEVQR
jgi:hypothetical protein